ncbi:MAG TPA: HAMP domain-containing sensor histidine kinase [Thermoanaerobaculia bacterium]|jgi:signal transduction histidine kinase|nr:HAMP domain-containing sensor histidine kinase [Thermoanaerobaculia bacterium]
MPSAPPRATATPAAARAETLRWVVGSVCAALGALILVAPHRFAAPIFDASPALRDLWGAAALAAGVGLLGVAVLRPGPLATRLAHLLAALALLALAAAFARSGIWVAAAANLVLAAATGAAGWLPVRRAAPAGDRPADLYAGVMGAIAALNGAALLTVPAASRAPYFGPAHPVVPSLAGLMLLGGIAMAMAQVLPRLPFAAVLLAHLLGGGAFLAFGLLVSARQQAWTALGVNLVYGGTLLLAPWLSPRLAHLDTSALRVRLAFTLATSTSLALIVTAAALTRQPPVDVRRARDLTLVFLLVVVPIAVAAGLLLARRVARPLARLADAVTQLPSDEGAVDTAAEEADIAEVARLAAAFVALRARVAERSAESSRLAAELRARAQTLEELDRRKDEFLAMLGHELRNPIGAIANSANVLQRLATDPQQQRATELILRQVEHVIRLLEDLLDASRITRGKLTLRPATLDLREVVQRAVETTRPLFEAKRQELQVDLAAEPLGLQADGVRLEQVVGNLLRNASDYTPPGGRIEVAVFSGDGEAVVRVRDNGSGIPAELLPRVFEPFQQGPQQAGQGGLGIGLTLVKSLVELHGGRVEVRSDGAGKGSEFLARLPLLSAVPASPAS